MTTPDHEPEIRLAEAAALIGMSKAFLRGSTCPRRRHRGNGPKGKPVLTFRASEVLAWWKRREIGADGEPARRVG